MKRKVDLAKNVMWHVSAVLACALLKNEESAGVFPLARQGKPKNGAYGRAAQKRRPYTGNSKKYFKKDVTMQ